MRKIEFYSSILIRIFLITMNIFLVIFNDISGIQIEKILIKKIKLNVFYII